MSNLILLTNSFPYGNWEPYLETEVHYYDDFDQILICSLQIRKEHKDKIRKLPSDKFKICPVYYAPRYVYLLNAITAFADKNLYKELLKLAKQHRLSLKRIVKLFVYISRSNYEARILLNYLKENGLYNSTDNGVIYSYRFEYQPYVGLLIRQHLPNYRVVARGHRYDLYEESNSVSYIPLREILLRSLDKVIMIADDGKNYLSKKFPRFRDKIVVSRLGTIDYSVKETNCPQGEINLVSCSNVVSVKRIDLIVRALAEVKNVKVNWTHYGEGVLMDEVKELCSRTFPSNIHFNFRGFVANQKVLEEYAEKPYHLFLNVSESEGIPVSIMEVMSFGIPCIATDVGGTKEIVTDGRNGVLLDKDFKPEELSEWICRFAKMSEKEYQHYRKNAREDWENKYSANKNYEEFVKTLCQEIRK
ncbi:glycosyltransferase [Schinkia azotoformans]|uniref:glycosyltransferase n=1 Tax=Schinkia azotoformans TaxID=1454 RepID=UPI002DBF4DC9|nr:glycosyltransferase [Schinkia azotoformans]MEC1747889.1 glycosyltransferase [Schinkia azotoformans]